MHTTEWSPRQSKPAETQHRPSPGWRTRNPNFACSIATRTPSHTPTAERSRGFATSALAAGATERAVREHGRWRSAAAMAPYIDEAERFADTNPTRVLGRRPSQAERSM